MVTKVQKMIHSLRTTEPFETWHKNRDHHSKLCFLFLKFSKNQNKLLEIQKWKDFNGNGYLQGVRHAAPYEDHSGLLWRPLWIQNGR
jgi:hypothetical protein